MTVDQAFALPAPGVAPTRVPPGYTATETPYGLRVDGPDGGRLLYAAPSAAEPRPDEAAPAAAEGGSRSAVPPQQVDVALVDVVESPMTIGALRRAGVVGNTTAVVALGGDHRVHSPAEFARRARLWGALAPSDGQELRCPPSAWPPPRIRGPYRVLLTGGARSGKSAEAERRMLGEPEVTYLATGPRPGDDADWAKRVAAHQERRPWWWRTVETGDAAGVLAEAAGAVLLDCVGTWLAATMEECGLWREVPPADAEEAVWNRVAELVSAWRGCSAYVVAVTNEVGSGVVPATASGRLFRDWLGRLNQLLAAESEEVALVTAGRVLQLP
ncbi:bifunctional adenosylcobinamide kinase/adenosylcobinamide-phosphate guanylyltransferase [Marinitenerispora sediminis]|uniref:Adenosylcobinamide kinase n=1 Tax=Marinitenerispora sediminis TaxID=1931232 RepID=A0A368SZZ6_9ACTN|nr:bifunctional adenosylcobinamide kinase/adenosylcobinamide-phosphate guanylyltransferase [Marinitenerispora sediminis]RCV52056.1 adenosylcobinamide kinase [Marinitenerispora sediminis]RCV54150.1 adenosylcobinamide kinase [Marinitenerispora sediminis]RCV54371.1 adenosylcobinamide kinase [Marinitenerispora sediminis]